MAHLISTDIFELVIDGCQYTRPEKTEKISEWEIAQKHLNVCINPLDHGENCSCCSKCMRTMIALEAMGKLDKFDKVFDLEIYRKKNKFYKYEFVRNYKKDAISTSLVDYAKENNLRMPTKLFINTRMFIYRAIKKIERIIQN